MKPEETTETFSIVFEGSDDRIPEIDKAVGIFSTEAEDDLNAEIAQGNAKTTLIRSYNHGLEALAEKMRPLSIKERLFVDFGFLDPRLVSERPGIIDLIVKELHTDHSNYPNVLFLSEWFEKVCKEEKQTTFFMMQDARTRKELRERSPDRISLLKEEIKILREIRISCARSGNVPGSLPILTHKWIDHDPSTCFNTKGIVASKLREFENMCPFIFTKMRSGKRINTSTIIFPGSGYGTSIAYKDEGRIFIPNLNPPSGKSLEIPQRDKCLLVAVARLCWAVLTPFPGWQDNVEELPGKFEQWKLRQGIKGITSRCFTEQFLVYMTKEAQGIQKLDAELREMFWRHLPYSTEKRDELSKRAKVFADLNKKLTGHYGRIFP